MISIDASTVSFLLFLDLLMPGLPLLLLGQFLLFGRFLLPRNLLLFLHLLELLFDLNHRSLGIGFICLSLDLLLPMRVHVEAFSVEICLLLELCDLLEGYH